MPGMYEAQIPLKQREIMNKICETQAHDTKLFSAIRKGGNIGKLEYNWNLSSRTRGGHKGVKDGADQTTFGKQERVPAKAIAMEQREAWHVSQKTNATKQEGPEGGSERKYQKAEAAIRLKNKMEDRIGSDIAPVQETTVDTADGTGGILWWLMNGVSTYFTIPEAHRLPAACQYTGALSNFSEKVFEGMIAQALIDTNGGNINLDGWCGIHLKNRFNDFSAYDTDGEGADNLRVYNFDGKTKTVMRCVDFLYLSEGTVRLHPTVNLLRDEATGASHVDAHRTGVFLNMPSWWIRFVEAMKHTDNSDEGGGPRGFWSANWLLHPETILGQLAIRCSG